MPTCANGQPAFGVYLRAPAGVRHGTGLLVLSLTGDRICAITGAAPRGLLFRDHAITRAPNITRSARLGAPDRRIGAVRLPSATRTRPTARSRLVGDYHRDAGVPSLVGR